MNKVLEQIKNFADQAHGTQQRKFTAERYIVHPIRVMEICREYTSELPVLAAALLHDVLEDTPVTEQMIQEFLLTVLSPADTGKTMQLVIDLTDVYVKNSYPHWKRRKRKEHECLRMEKTCADAQTIKYADILDNGMEIMLQETDFAEVYLRESRQLLKHIPKGHPQLYARVLAAIHP